LVEHSCRSRQMKKNIAETSSNSAAGFQS